ncbi:MAG: efflux RND transporter periplasmic adaptor subunit [Nannocystales bacterium]
MKRRVFMVSGLAALSAATTSAGCLGDVLEAEVPTFEVQPAATFVRRVRAEGLLAAVEATSVTAPQDSKRPMKIAWVAEDGLTVKEGDLVVEFDASEMERTLADSQDDVSASSKRMKKEGVSARANEAKRDVTAALSDSEAAVAREFETDDAEILSRNEIVESSIDVELAEAKARHARRVKDIERAVSSKQIDLLSIQKNLSSREVQRAEEGLAKLQVKAPHDGILVLKRNWRGDPIRVGDTVWRGQKLAELPHVAALEAKVHVLEADAGNLVAGLPAEVVIDAHPSQAYEATLQKMDTLAQPKHHEVPVHYFGVTLELAKTDPETMRIGQRIQATILVEEPEALVVPRQAIFDEDGKSIVYKRGVGGFDATVVELGSASAGRVVITSGIEAGDQVALRDPHEDADALLGADDDAKSAERPKTPGGPR